MNARRRFASVSAQLVRDFLIFALRHGSTLRRAYYDRIILIAVHELTYNYRADVRITEYAVTHIIAAEKRRDNLGVRKLLR